MLKAAGLSFSYGSAPPAVAGADVRVRPGEVVGVLGPNGSGKSTLLGLFAGALEPSSGSVRVAGAPAGSRSARRATAVVFDRLPFRERLGGREQAERLTRLRGVDRATAREAVDRWLRRLGLAQRAEDPVGTYSGGMRRKLALVEAFASGAPLLLLDEPLGGLDLSAREALREALADHAGRDGAAVASLHDAEFAAEACDRVLFLRSGRVVGGGPPAALVRELGLSTVVRVEVAGAPPREPSPPAPFRWLEPEGRALRIACPDGPRDLPELCAWLLGAGHRVRSLTVCEPGLADVYLRLAGTPLRDGEELPGRADRGGPSGGRRRAGTGRRRVAP